MFVELDAFSGRPNPRWQLDPKDTEELLRLQDRLELSVGPPVEPPGLGYRGFVYWDPGGTYRAYQGRVITPKSVLADPSYTVERFLLARVPEEFAPLRQRIATELGRDR
jgi:hypothetical protein